MEKTENIVSVRGQKIKKVAESLGLVHKMYQNLNEIVDQQGITLNRIEDNVAEAQFNTKEAHKELKTALSREKTLKERVQEGDASISCLIIVFGFVMLMIIVDFFLNGPDTLQLN